MTDRPALPAWTQLEVDVEACGSSRVKCFAGDVGAAAGDEALLIRVGHERARAEGVLIGKTVIDGQPTLVGELVHVEDYEGVLPLLLAFREGPSTTSLLVTRCLATYADSVDDLEEHRLEHVSQRVARLRVMREQKRTMAALLPAMQKEVDRLDGMLARIATWLGSTGRDEEPWTSPRGSQSGGEAQGSQQPSWIPGTGSGPSALTEKP